MYLAALEQATTVGGNWRYTANRDHDLRQAHVITAHAQVQEEQRDWLTSSPLFTPKSSSMTDQHAHTRDLNEQLRSSSAQGVSLITLQRDGTR